MITILFHTKIRADRAAEFADVARELTRTTRAEDDGCVGYTFLQREDDPAQVVLFEQWRDREALLAHIRRLVDAYGPPRQGEALPAKLMEMFERTEVIHYVPLA